MCGIIGAVGHDVLNLNRDKALDALTHRGPDATGSWNCNRSTIWLAHKRLSIIDLSEAANQPMHLKEHHLSLVFNGEIYNYKEIKKELIALGAKFVTNSDTEVILHAYKEWGVNCVQRFEGMFAFALWDGLSGELVLARDRVGMKPLYFIKLGRGIAFASEARALKTLIEPVKSLDISPSSIGYVLTLGYVPAPDSIWQDIEKLLPGTMLIWNANKGIKGFRYWEPPLSLDSNFSYRHTSDEFEALLNKVTKQHLIADVDPGLFLSGGLDSAAIAAASSKHGAPRIEAFTISYPGTDRDESAIASVVAEHLGMQHTIVPMHSYDIQDLLERVSNDYDEPMSFSSLLSMHQICSIAKGRYKMVLSGDGGDEVLGGYHWYRDRRLLDRKIPYPTWLRKRLTLSKTNYVPKRLKNRALFALFGFKSKLHMHAARLSQRFLPEEVETLLEPTSIKFSDETMLEPLSRYDSCMLPPRRRLQRIDLMTFCSDHCCPKIDRSSMAHSLEIRAPFLDRRLIEWGLTMPESELERHTGKIALRNYLSNKMPLNVLNQPKRGFSVPIGKKYDWEEAIKYIDNGELLDKGILADDWKKIVSPFNSNASRIWALLSLEAWLQRHTK